MDYSSTNRQKKSLACCPRVALSGRLQGLCSVVGVALLAEGCGTSLHRQEHSGVGVLTETVTALSNSSPPHSFHPLSTARSVTLDDVRGDDEDDDTVPHLHLHLLIYTCLVFHFVSLLVFIVVLFVFPIVLVVTSGFLG